MQNLSETLGLRAANLYSEGLSFGKISEELEVSKSRVGALIRAGINSMANHDGDPEGALVVQPVNEQENEGSLIPDYEDDSDLDGIWEKTLLIHATPILKKVALNSKVFLQHEYFQKHLGYEKDVGDLLVEALDYYWKEMGFTIRVTHNSVIE